MEKTNMADNNYPYDKKTGDVKQASSRSKTVDIEIFKA